MKVALASAGQTDDTRVGRFHARITLLVLALGGALSVLWLGREALRDPNVSFLPPGGPGEWVVYPLRPETLARLDKKDRVTFRRTWTVPSAPDAAVLEIRAFRRFEVRINGTRVASSEASPLDWKRPLRVVLRQPLRDGENRIEADVWNEHGPPALQLDLLVDAGARLRTDATWQASRDGALWPWARKASEPMDSLALSPDEPKVTTGRALRNKAWPLLFLAACATAVVLAAERLARRTLAKPGGEGRLVSPMLVQVVLVVGVGSWAALFWNNLSSLHPSDGFDPDAHLEYVQFLLDRGTLPRPHEGWSMYHPPLFYALAAGVLKAADLTTQDEAGVRLLRLLCMGLGTAHLAFVTLSLGRLFPERPLLQLQGSILAAFLPMHFYIFHLVTNESLAAALSSAAVWAALGVLQADRPSLLRHVSLGALLGAAVLAKVSALLVVGAVAVALLAKLASGGGPMRERAAGLAGTLGACLAICGWRHVALWVWYGKPLAGNWDPEVLEPWWQDPGYWTTDWVFRFGRSLVQPVWSSFHGYLDGVYSTLWGDGLAGGAAALWRAFPWEPDRMAAGYLLALLPTAAVAIGCAVAIGRSWREARSDWLLIHSLAGGAVIAATHMVLQVASYAQVKAFYALPATVALCAYGALGFDLLSKPGAVARGLVLVAGLTWAFNAYATFWIPRESPRATARLGRILARRGEREDEAERLLQAAIRQEPGNASARLGMALLLERRGRKDEAVLHLRRLLSEHPNHSVALAELARLASPDPPP